MYIQPIQGACLPSNRKINRVVNPLADSANGEWAFFDVRANPTIIVCELTLILLEAFVQLDDIRVLKISREPENL